MQEPEEKAHPAAEAALEAGRARLWRLDGVVPTPFHFSQTLLLHTGSKPNHPANRKVTLEVGVADLAARYWLCDDGLQFLCQVRGLLSLLR